MADELISEQFIDWMVDELVNEQYTDWMVDELISEQLLDWMLMNWSVDSNRLNGWWIGQWTINRLNSWWTGQLLDRIINELTG